MTLNKTINTIKKIDGWLTDNEAKLLYNLAKNAPNKGVIVEIGSWKGKSTIALANGSREGKKIKVYAIDPHIGSEEHQKKGKKIWTFDEFKKNIKKAKLNDFVIPLKMTSKEANKKFNKKIELIFIDGAHDYQNVKTDYELWFPKIVDGGIIAFHDTTTWDGPKKLVKEKIFKSRQVKNIRILDSITYCTKTQNNSKIEFIKNHLKLLKKEGVEIYYQARYSKKLKFLKKIIKFKPKKY